MKKFKVAAVFQSWGTLEVEAESYEDLLVKLKDKDFLNELPLPEDSLYVDDSFKIDEDYGIEEV